MLLLATQVGGCQQALHHLTVFQVRLDNFINVAGIYIAVPNGFRINHRHWSGGATVKATCLVDPNLAGAIKSGGLDLGLAAVKGGHGSVTGAAGFPLFALIEAEKYMSLVVTDNRVSAWVSRLERCRIGHAAILGFWLVAPEQAQYINQCGKRP